MKRLNLVLLAVIVLSLVALPSATAQSPAAYITIHCRFKSVDRAPFNGYPASVEGWVSTVPALGTHGVINYRDLGDGAGFDLDVSVVRYNPIDGGWVVTGTVFGTPTKYGFYPGKIIDMTLYDHSADGKTDTIAANQDERPCIDDEGGGNGIIIGPPIAPAP